MNRANFKFLSKWDSHFEIAVCYQPSTNRQLGRKTRRVRFIFHPLLSASICESIAVIQRASFAIEYISARIAFSPPVCYFPCIQISATSHPPTTSNTIVNTRQFGTRVEWQKILWKAITAIRVFFFFRKMRYTISCKILSINILHCNNYLVRSF